MPTAINNPGAATSRTNILHDYANYDYHLQLWAMTYTDFNKISKGSITVGQENQILQNGTLLISHGGSGASEKRSSQFPFDMVIDNLVIESVVGNKGSGARGIDTLTLKFDIIEPYTVTLINRLVLLAAQQGQDQDFKTLLYAFKLSFLGYDDNGTPISIDKATKWIPFTMLNMQFNITNKGAVYTCQGIPTQNLVMTMIDNTIPFHIELQGVTIQDLFNATAVTTGSTNQRSDTTTAPNNNNTAITQGIAQALNQNETYKKNLGTIDIENKYAFEFDPELLAATIIDPSEVQTQSRPSPPAAGAAGAAALASARLGTLNLDVVSGKFRTQAGTKITDFIQSIMLTTDFMKKQVATNGAPSKDKPFYGIQIIPKLEIIGYDTKTNFFARKVTYSVKKFAYYGEDHPSLPQQTYPPNSIVKNYEYLFTGNNRDVKKVNLDYKIAFFDLRNSVKRNSSEESLTGSGQDPNTDGGAERLNTRNTSAFGRPSFFNVAGNMPNLTNAGANNKNSMVLAEMVTKLFDNGVDLITLDLDIVGDPDWIQQDNVLYGPMAAGQSKTLSNGVINFQDSITCFQFTFKSPVNDYDEVTGLFDVKDSNTATFSGTYQVLTVSSKFSRGMFTQSLTNVRLRLQEAKNTTAPPPVVTAGGANDGRVVA